MRNIKWVENRLYPVRFHSRYTILTGLRKALQSAIGKNLKGKLSELILVDLGCGAMPYRPLFEKYISRYVGVDLISNKEADFYFDESCKSPLEDGFADVVLSTQVLEHVAKPSLYLLECNRILKSGGILILSTHGYWPYHPDPHDYWRWTCEGLRNEVEAAGFKIVDFEGVMGLGAVGLQMLQDALLPRIPNFMRYIRYFCAAIFQVLIQFADRLSSDNQRRKDAWVFVLVALKTFNKQGATADIR